MVFLLMQVVNNWLYRIKTTIRPHGALTLRFHVVLYAHFTMIFFHNYFHLDMNTYYIIYICNTYCIDP